MPAAIVQAVVPQTARLVLLGLVTAVALACDVRVLPFRMPQNSRLVPSTILARSDGTGALQFGFEMGTGLRTFMPTHLPYVLVGVALLGAEWWLSPLLGACFGVGRALMVRLAVASGDATTWHSSFVRHRRLIHMLCWTAAVACTASIVTGLR